MAMEQAVSMSNQTSDEPAPAFNLDVFEAAADLLAMWLARFRDEDSEPNDNDRLTAGHLAGALAANNLLVPTLPEGSDVIGADGTKHPF
jgi:hypothetical protein